ncbi:hypothetical protein DFP72DRAFT_828127 [Ephemerocybe angulata]|uniref:Uncharacterized protein n=1 Tax=Ephemerocybe angulata TaxID=980116 RepID=A0A8H6LWJ3_9AGAR|nr:hypothetical protein DFP72DRAFT_828127 [Tulosesus angulatus]
MPLDDVQSWSNPVYSFAYSQGKPDSRFSKTDFKKVSLLKKFGGGEMVDCQVSHTTCQGIKELRERLKADRALRIGTPAIRADSTWDLDAALLRRTLSYYEAVRIQGCLAPKYEETRRTNEEQREYESLQEANTKARRGHDPKETCDGRVIFEEWPRIGAVIRCEHYSTKGNRDHFKNTSLSNGQYDVRYLKALFTGDKETVESIEEDLAIFHGSGPSTSCSFTASSSSVRVYCPYPHRDSAGNLIRAELKRVQCKTTFRFFQPIEQHRRECPWTLVTSSGAHTHPIPVLSKTPPAIVCQFLQLINSLKDELPDMTARRLIHHSNTRTFVRAAVKDSTIEDPQLSDLHPSLANLDHVQTYLDRVKQDRFPLGMGINGLRRLKEEQDSDPSAVPYIRYISQDSSCIVGDDDDSADEAEDHARSGDQDPLFICICMTPMSSRRLLEARDAQSDISFKRVSGFYEFVLGGLLDNGSNIAYVYARVYVTRQTAAAHRLIFTKIGEIVKADTGQDLKWRHLHAEGIDSFMGLCFFNADQHRGQAKGLGLYLKDVAAKLPSKPDLHEPQRKIQDLDEYEHLRRVLHLCTNHLLRNIESTAVSDEVKGLMRSLLSLEHPNWESTIAEIRRKGGKAGNNWLDDKITSKFAFAAMCNQHSFIPRPIWQLYDRTTNLIESLHADANREGRRCSLLSGLFKGKRFDLRKEKSAQSFERYGILPYHSVNTDIEKITRGLKRGANSAHSILAHQDGRIMTANKRMKLAHEARGVGTQRAEERFKSAITHSLSHRGTGSGKVGLLLPRAE